MTQEPTHSEAVPVCDYEGSDYRTRFWENQGREYEDLAERIAIRRLLPPTGDLLLEIGTGFGRLVDLYQGYRHIILLDYSKSLLRQARERLGHHSARYTYIAANVYQLPLRESLVDTVCMVRVIHHLADVPGALRQVSAVTRPGGTFLLEHASKIHLKSILRYALRRQDWSPYADEPVEFVALNFDFHPRWIRARLGDAGFEVAHTRTVSRFRIPLLKRLVSPRLLARLDGALQGLGELWQLTPSVFVAARRQDTGGEQASLSWTSDPTLLFRCPTCEQCNWNRSESEMHCLSCNTRWAIDDGIFDFKTAI